ncbi:MAG: DUF1254 domain-containing protein [Deltaproteobacteria bacterium]|nr:DUF1254 domain-containing protein [Deltaproteobacteria bacterium]
MTEPRRPAAAAWLAVTALVALLGSAGAAALPLSDAQILAAYDYLLARALVAARQHDELEHGMTWNQLVHRDAPSPAEPDVLLSDAWIALDDASCAVLSLPAAGGRYLDAQLIDGWGTTLAHVNPRRYPYHPSGEFALCRRGARSALPRGAERLELPVSIVRLRVRVAVGADLYAARRLQQQIALVSTGSPAPPESVCLPPFSQAPLPGLEMFDNADALLRDAPDPAPDADRAQQAVRAVAAALANPLQRNRVETVIQRQAIPRVQLARLRLGALENGWLRWQPLAGSVD